MPDEPVDDILQETPPENVINPTADGGASVRDTSTLNLNQGSGGLSPETPAINQ